MKQCLKCLVPVPEGRTRLGYKVCVKCSSTEAYGCIAVTNHKTGNTIQITDQATANAFHKASQRKGYGIMSGIKRS